MNQTQFSRKALTPKDCKKIYGLNPGTLANLRHQQRGPRFYRRGRKIFYRVEDIEDYIFSNPVQTLDTIKSRRYD